MDSLAKKMIGKKVLVRSYSEGINSGIVVDADETGVELKDARRLWHHAPADKNVCWYEGVAVSGLSEHSDVSCTVPCKVIIEDYSMTLVDDEAFESIMTKEPKKQK